MSKSEFLKVRIDADEMREVERITRAAKMTKSEFVRTAITAALSPVTRAAPSVDPSRIDDLASRLESLEAAVSTIAAEVREAAKAHIALAERIAELTRVPTFREYRSRALAEGIEQRPGESETSYLTRLAIRYFALYGRWPDPQEPDSGFTNGAQYGTQLVIADRWYPSSRLCSVCGWKNEMLTLRDREWVCPECGTHHDRDLNAALNLQRLATATALPVASPSGNGGAAAEKVSAVVGKVTPVRYEPSSGQEENCAHDCARF